MISVKDLSVSYGENKVLDGISFELDKGSWLMIAGPNGAGKSTLIKAISGAADHGGSVMLGGRDIKSMKSRELARVAGILSQTHFASYAYSVDELIRLGLYSHRKGFLSPPDEGSEAVYEEAVRRTGLNELLGRSILEISGGELQRAYLARLFAQDPEILLLDEPGNHLDPAYQKQIYELIDEWRNEKKRTIISVVHDLGIARKYGDRLLLLDKGRIAIYGDTESSFDEEIISRVYGMDIGEWMRDIYRLWERS